MRTIVSILCLIASAGCRQDMARQPAYRPLRESTFFADGRAARPLVPGTVARGSKQSSGLRAIGPDDFRRAASLVASLADNPLGAAERTSDWTFYRETFPAPLSEKTLARGRERYEIYCAVCHDRVGNGKGMIVARGFTPPPSLHTDWSRGFKLKGADLKLSAAPVGYYFEVITRGFGAMPDYRDQIPPDDRWAIVAYIRALQLSQRATLADIADATARERLTKGADAP